jgi:thiamine biosynthesis lipoprotein
MRRIDRRVLVGLVLAAALGALTMATRRCVRTPALSANQSGASRETASDAAPRYAHAFFATMGTRVELLVPAAQQGAAEEVRAAFGEANAQMSTYLEASAISRVNRAAGQGPVPAPAELRAVVARGLEISRLSDGAFDVSWAALHGLWDFRAARPRVPSAVEIAARVPLVDYRQVVVDPAAGTIALRRPGMRIDLGGIAKGFALDRAAARLRQRGVRSFLISGGGQVIAGGRRGDRPWRVGIRDPRGPIADSCASLDFGDASISTSGDYERFFEQGGVRYHHILDPRTGRPARAGLRSATVLAAEGTTADALSTAVIVLGKDRGLALMRRIPGVEAVLIDDAGQAHVTAGLQGKLTWHHPPRR